MTGYIYSPTSFGVEPYETTLNCVGYADVYVASLHTDPLYTFAASTSGRGTVLLDPPGGAYFGSQDVTVRAEPLFPTHDTFERWEGDLSGTEATHYITPSSDMTFNAVFSEVVDPPELPALSGLALAGLALALGVAGARSRQR